MMKTSNAMVTIDQIGVCGNHMNMLTIESDAMMMAATRAHVAPQNRPKATAASSIPTTMWIHPHVLVLNS